MNEDRLKYLLKQFETDQLDEDEAKELLGLIQKGQDENLIADISSRLTHQSPDFFLKDERWPIILNEILAVDRYRFSRRPLFRWISVAAVFLVVSFTAFYFFNSQDPAALQSKTNPVRNKIPTGDHAVLTLANGERITLDYHSAGIVAEQGSSKITKQKNGELEVTSLKNDLTDQKSDLLMVETPHGGKYSVTLPDGTRAWLNAASSIRFPTSFSKHSREVQITGEVYFEVVNVSKINPDNKWPFLVKTGNHVVEVLGTHFDINAYADADEIKTTLMEGSVKVYKASSSKNNQNSVTLKPGQQAAMKVSSLRSDESGSPVVRQADIEQVLAWKNNLFKFNNSDIHLIMTEISRWYNLKVKYENEISPQELTGYVSREVPVAKVLEMLEATSNLKFSIHDNTIFVRNTK